MRTRSWLAVGAVVLLVLLSGCLGGGGGGGDETPTDAPGDGGFDFGGGDGDTPAADDTPVPDGDATGSCGEGGMSSYRDPQSGEQISMEIEGTVTHDGRQVCKAVWQSSGGASGAYARIEMFYAPDGSYQKYVYYDAEGNVLYEFQTGGPGAETPAGSDGATPTDGTGDPPADSWCVEGQTTSMANPQTGETTSMKVEGLVQHNGRQTCKAVWETSGGQSQIQRIVWFYTESSGYMHILYYDGEGNVINEVETGGGTN